MPDSLFDFAMMFRSPRPEYRERCQASGEVLELPADTPLREAADRLAVEGALPDLVLLTAPDGLPVGLASPRLLGEAAVELLSGLAGQPEGPGEFASSLRAVKGLGKGLMGKDGPMGAAISLRLYECTSCQWVGFENPCPRDGSPCNPVNW